jgi:hypothetical protein
LQCVCSITVNSFAQSEISAKPALSIENVPLDLLGRAAEKRNQLNQLNGGTLPDLL